MLACWMPVGGSLRDVAGRTGITASRGAGVIGAGADAIEARDVGSNGHWGGTAPDAIRPTAAFSVMWRGRVIGAGDATDNPAFVGCYHNNTNGAPFTSWGLHRNASNQISLYWNNSSFQALSVASAITTGAVHSLVGVVTPGGGAGAAAIYRDGASIATGSPAAGAIAYNASAVLRIGGHVTTTSSFVNCGMHIAAVWNRALSAAEVRMLARAPFCFLIPAG
jgi:hypothetical protein